MSTKQYFSPFKRVPVTAQGGNKIKIIQDEYDIFWKKLNRIVEKSPEKLTAMRALQESCMWLTRAIAITNINPIEHSIAPKNDGLSEILEKYKEAEQIPIKNSPTIIFKKTKL